MPQMGPQLWLVVQIVGMLVMLWMLTTSMCTPLLGTPPTPPGSSGLPWLW